MSLTRTALALRVFSTALLLTGLTAFAQDDKPKVDETPMPHVYTSDYHTEEKAWEDKLHTTDCYLMPNRTIATDCEQIHRTTKTFFLKNVSQQNDANEILVALRNLLDPSVKIYLIASQNAIAISTYPQQIAKAEAIINTLDRPRPAYRITFTIVDVDSGKRVGIQHYAMEAYDGQRASMKQGSKVPVSTGSYSNTDKSMQQQFTYLDVGMSFDLTPTHVEDGIVLKAKVEQSAVADSQTIAGVQEPIIRQSVFDGVVKAPLGKPVTLGALDIPGSTHHMDIEVLVEQM